MSGYRTAQAALRWLAVNPERRVTIRTAGCVTTSVRFEFVPERGNELNQIIWATYPTHTNTSIKLIDPHAVVSINLIEPSGSEL